MTKSRHLKNTMDPASVDPAVAPYGETRMNHSERTMKSLEGETIGVQCHQQSTNSNSTPLLHRLFELGVVAKGADGVLELFGGLLLLILPSAAIRGTIFFLVQGELKEDPTDLVANLLVHHTLTVIQNKVPASTFLLVHGVVKLALVGGLVTNKLWSYPAAIVVFTGFVIYQVYQLSQQNSLFLGIVTILDIIVVFLVIAEYRHKRLASRRHL